MTEVPAAFWAVIAFVFGAIVGSFLNVVIWRLPRGQSLSTPPSHCPKCDRRLAAWENIPLVSFLALRARCRTCKAPISWRYFGVELLTALLFLVLYLHFGATLETVAYCLFSAALLAGLFIDLELFIIPDELNTFALLVGIGFDLWGIATHRPGHDLLWGWLPHSILGAVICAGVFVFIQVLGLALLRKDAMGDGDVKLARAIGAMLPLSQALVSFFLAIATGAVLGVALLAWQSARTRPAAEGEESEADGGEEPEPEVSTWGELLLRGIIYVTCFDLLLQLGRFLRIPPAERLANAVDPVEEIEEEDDWVPGPTHIPFGPYMVVGALLAVFVGDRLLNWYKAWSHL